MRLLKPLLLGATLIGVAAPALASAEPYFDRGGDYRYERAYGRYDDGDRWTGGDYRDGWRHDFRYERRPWRHHYHFWRMDSWRGDGWR